MALGEPRRAMNRRSAFKQESVINSAAISMWIALMVKHLINTPYLLTVLLPRLTSKDPK